MYYVNVATSPAANGQGIHSSRMDYLQGGNIQCYEVHGEGRNSDGLNIGNSKNLILQNFRIYSEDDCVSFVENDSGITVRDGMCLGPTHGISLGAYKSYAQVTRIRVENILFHTRGRLGNQVIHIKSSPHASGVVDDVVFNKIRVVGRFSTYVYIDQNYGSLWVPVGAQMVYQNIQVNNFSGRATSKNENIFNCGKGLCRNIQIRNWSLNGQSEPLFSIKNNS
jgi:polygalacturonase